MIKFYFLLIFFATASCSVNASSRQLNINISDTCVYKIHVTKIISLRKAYIIYAFNERDSSQFAIVSLKIKSKTGEKIKAGNSYSIRLHPYFDNEIFPDHMVMFEVIVSGIKIIIPSEGWASNVFTSQDLKGLRITQHSICH